ncbi:MAG: two-component sensor histidine kinase [Deltaproteobacteria bacterium RBG_19FT_COMBO_46_9]|nr:MAG: two-component sensor histidine kinase [Deltaproteobacteria bacterium RBG_19FT_COMBO_46_9]
MEEKYYKKLWWKIVFTTLGFSLIPLFALGITIYYQFSVSYTAKIIENLKTLVENRRSSMDLFFDERVSQLVTVANTHTLKQLGEETYLNKIFKTMQTRSQSFIDIGIIDQEGNHLAYIGPYPDLKEVNYKNEDWFESVLSKGVYISDVFMGFRKFPHFIIAVMSREGGKTWILRATINSDIIENVVRAAQIGKKGDAFIINKRNILQTAPRFSGELFGHPQTPDFSKTVETLVEEIVLDGENNFFAATEISNAKWILVIKEDPKEQLTPLLKARYIAVILFLAGILIIVIGTLLTTRSMMNKLIRIDREKAVSEDMVIQSSKMAALGKMAAGIAHEINNPLAVIGEKAGWIKDLLAEEDVAKSKNLKEFEDAVRKIEYHVERTKKVTHRLLGFARRMEPTLERVDVNKTLNDTVDFLENESKYRNIDIQVDFQPDLPKIMSDSSQLQQIFLNIINNAIDAIDKGGEIRIKTTHVPKNNEIMIEVTDNGPGISKENINKIFDPFFTTKEVGKGTGLGLSIVYSIIEKLGGRIMVASEFGQGTTFTIYLPVKE